MDATNSESFTEREIFECTVPIFVVSPSVCTMCTIIKFLMIFMVMVWIIQQVFNKHSKDGGVHTSWTGL